MKITDQQRTAYRQGKEAKENGYERRAPCYNVKAEASWLRGYDGIDCPEAKEKQQHKKVQSKCAEDPLETLVTQFIVLTGANRQDVNENVQFTKGQLKDFTQRIVKHSLVVACKNYNNSGDEWDRAIEHVCRLLKLEFGL